MENIIAFVIAIGLFNISENLVSIMNLFASIVMAVTSILNIVIIIRYYNNDKVDKTQNEVLMKKSFWFRNSLEKNYNLINDYFDNSFRLIDECKSNINEEKSVKQNKQVCKTFLGENTDQRIKVRNCFISEIRAVDFLFGQALENLFDNFQDEFTALFMGLAVSTASEDYMQIERVVSNQKEKLFSALYNYEICGYKNNK